MSNNTKYCFYTTHFHCTVTFDVKSWDIYLPTENLPDDLFVSWNVLELQPRPQPAARCPVSHKMARVC